MTAFEELLETHQRALRDYSDAMDRRNRALGLLAEAKASSARNVPERQASFSSAEEEFNRTFRELEDVSKRLRVARAQRILEAAMFKPSAATRSQPF